MPRNEVCLHNKGDTTACVFTYTDHIPSAAISAIGDNREIVSQRLVYTTDGVAWGVEVKPPIKKDQDISRLTQILASNVCKNCVVVVPRYN